jgi:hypothetical protein
MIAIAATRLARETGEDAVEIAQRMAEHYNAAWDSFRRLPRAERRALRADYDRRHASNEAGSFGVNDY